MTYRIKLVHIGKKDEMNNTLIRLMSIASSSTSSLRTATEPEEISFRSNNINLLVTIKDETMQEQWIIAKPGYAFVAGAILIYDVTRRESYQDSFDWIKSFKQHAPQSAVVLLIANTSCVNTKPRVISAEEGEGFATNAEVLYCEASLSAPTSAKQALNIIIQSISQKIANGTIRPGLENGVVSVLRLPMERRHTTSCASPLTPREPLVYPIPNTEQRSWDSETIPKEVELESKLCFAEEKVEKMKKSSEAEKNKWIMQEQKLIQANTEMGSKVKMLESRSRAVQMLLDDFKKQLNDRNSEIEMLRNENITLKQRLEHSTHHYKQENVHLSNAMKSSAQGSAFRQRQLEHELGLKEMALQNEAHYRREAEAALHRTQIALNQAMAEDHSLHQKSSVICDNWKVERHEITFFGAPLGQGAWGYVAEGKFRGMKVAVKCLHEAIMTPEATERVRREINTMASVRHPNIVLFIGAVLDEGPPVIISELLDTNLRTAYKQRLVNGINAKLNILHGVACALNYFHQQDDPIIHRDISAPNVLLKAAGDDKWTPKVSDFGSANLQQCSRTLGEGAIIYAAPEMYPSHSSLCSVNHTTKIDVYSFGVLVGELLTEELPNPESIHLTLQHIMAEWPHIYRLMDLCIKRNPHERPTMNTVIVDHLDPLLAC